MIVIGITGTLGAGKGTIVDFLIQQYGFRHYSVRNYLIKEAQRRNMPLNRDTYVVIANDLRSKYSPSYIIDQLYAEAQVVGQNAVIESIRTPGEVDSLRKTQNFSLWAVDAEPHLRYQRICSRKSETDRISFDVFVENEQREMNSQDPNKQNLSACIQMADHVLLNNGDLDNLHCQIKDILVKNNYK